VQIPRALLVASELMGLIETRIARGLSQRIPVAKAEIYLALMAVLIANDDSEALVGHCGDIEGKVPRARRYMVQKPAIEVEENAERRPSIAPEEMHRAGVANDETDIGSSVSDLKRTLGLYRLIVHLGWRIFVFMKRHRRDDPGSAHHLNRKGKDNEPLPDADHRSGYCVINT
jgi:hypothetical protein